MIAAWLGAPTRYKASDPALCATCLECMREWIGWAPLEQVTTDQFLGVLFDCLSSAGGDTQGLRLGACACLKELADKGMGTCERLYLLRRLKIIEVVERFGMPGGGGAGNGHRNVNMNGNGGGNHTANSSSQFVVARLRESIAAAMAAETLTTRSISPKRWPPW